jgi:hypothetical protein
MGSFSRRCGRLAGILFVLAPVAGAAVDIQVISGVESVYPAPDGTLYMWGEGIIATTPGAYLSLPPSDFPDFLTRYDPVAGRTLYTTYLNFFPTGMWIDATGAAYLIGRSYDPNFAITPGAYNRNITGGEEFVVAKLNPSGAAMFVTLLGGSGYPYGSPNITGVTVGAGGSIFVTGTTCSKDFPTTPGAFMTASANQNGCDAYLSELSPNGSTLVYSTYLGASQSSSGESISLSADGKVYLAGATAAPDFPTTPGTLTAPALSNTNSDRVFLAIWDPVSQQFDALAAFANGVNPRGFAWNGSRVVFYGPVNGFPSTPGAIWSMPAEGMAVLVVDLSTWQLVYATGLPDDTEVYAIGMDVDGSVTIAGDGTDAIPPSPGAYRASGAGPGTPFVLTFDASGLHILLATFFDINGLTGVVFTATVTPNRIYATQELFTTPVVINLYPPFLAIPNPPAPGVNCASINALPSVVQQCGYVVPQQFLRWDACDPQLTGVEVHRDAPNGPLFASSTAGGLSIAPNTTTYYLVDSSGNVLASEPTISQPAFRCSAVPNPQGQLTATPNPVLACAGNPPTGTETSLEGFSPSGQPSEIHVNAPNGPELAYSPTQGISAQTGDWVVNGTPFFLTTPGSATALAMDRVYLLPIVPCPAAPPPAPPASELSAASGPRAPVEAPAAIQAIPNRVACSTGPPAILAWNSAGIQPVEIRESSLTGALAGRFDATSGLLEVSPTATTTYHLAGYVAGVWQDLGSDTVYCGAFPF